MESRRFPFKIKFRLKIKYIGKISIKDVSSAKNNRPQAGFVRVNKAVKKIQNIKKYLRQNSFHQSCKLKSTTQRADLWVILSV